MKKAFTLIELLVVVLIIGILSAIALPQYQKAVARSKSTQALIMLKSVYQAALEYQLANGTWPTSFADLSVSIPWTGTTKWYNPSYITDVLSNDTWSLQLSSKDGYEGLNIGQITGKYTGGGFAIWTKNTGVEKQPVILCAEKIAAIETPGDYCHKVMQTSASYTSGSSLRYYNMP